MLGFGTDTFVNSAMERCDVNYTSNELMKNQYSTISWSIIVIFVPLVAAFGVASNLAFIFVVYRVEAMRTITNIFLVNLAIADSSLLVTAFAQYIGSYTNSPVYDLGYAFEDILRCVTPNFLTYLCYYTSLWTVTLVSIERYFAVCHPLWHMYMRSTRRSVYLVLASWIISVLFAIPTAATMIQIVCVISSEGSEIMEQITICNDHVDFEYWIIVIYATDFIQFVIALIVNIVLYSLIIRRVGKSLFAEPDGLQRTNSKKRRHSVAKMLIVNGIIFFVCLTPFSIVNVHSLGDYVGWFRLSSTILLPLAWIGRVLFLLNSALNPLIYNATNSRYRLAFKQAFLSRSRKPTRSMVSTIAIQDQCQLSTRMSQM